MARRRFFVDAVRNGKAELAGDAASHLIRVLRVEAGQQFEISDNDSLYLAEISAIGSGRVSFRMLETLASEETPLRISLAPALIKFERFELLLEKATELGVESIIPVNTERSEKGLFRAAQKRIDRWRKIARESSQQSRRFRLLDIRPPQQLPAFLAERPETAVLRYFLEERRQAKPLLRALPDRGKRSAADEVSLLVGPEGGWTDEERGQFTAAGWIPVSLGPHILRAETAALAAVAILVNAWQAE